MFIFVMQLFQNFLLIFNFIDDLFKRYIFVRTFKQLFIANQKLQRLTFEFIKDFSIYFIELNQSSQIFRDSLWFFKIIFFQWQFFLISLTFTEQTRTQFNYSLMKSSIFSSWISLMSFKKFRSRWEKSFAIVCFLSNTCFTSKSKNLIHVN